MLWHTIELDNSVLFAVLCYAVCVLCCAVLYTVLCCAVLCCVVLCCVVLCCVVLCCVVLCCCPRDCTRTLQSTPSGVPWNAVGESASSWSVLWLYDLCTSAVLYVCLSIGRDDCLSVYLSVFLTVSDCPSLSLCLSLFLCVSLFLSLSLSACLGTTTAAVLSFAFQKNTSDSLQFLSDQAALEHLKQVDALQRIIERKDRVIAVHTRHNAEPA